MIFGAADYRRGAAERLAESSVLLKSGNLAGSVYLAGRAVEAMLRAVIWTHDSQVRLGRKSLETGHDLRELLSHLRNLGLLRRGERDDAFEQRVQRIGRLWFNNMRFASTRYLETQWVRVGVVRKDRKMKEVSRRFRDDCAAVFERCEALCRS